MKRSRKKHQHSCKWFFGCWWRSNRESKQTQKTSLFVRRKSKKISSNMKFTMKKYYRQIHITCWRRTKNHPRQSGENFKTEATATVCKMRWFCCLFMARVLKELVGEEAVVHRFGERKVLHDCRCCRAREFLRLWGDFMPNIIELIKWSRILFAWACMRIYAIWFHWNFVIWRNFIILHGENYEM